MQFSFSDPGPGDYQTCQAIHEFLFFTPISCILILAPNSGKPTIKYNNRTAPHGNTGPPCPDLPRSNIYPCVSGIGLNICPPGGHGIPHQQGKHTIGICGIVDGDLDETAVDRIHGRFPELFRIHFP